MHARPTTVLLSLFWSDATMRISISGKLIRHLNETRWKPAIVGARQGNLVGKSSAANPSESIINHITSHLKHMLSSEYVWAEYTLPFQGSSNLSCLPVLGSIQSNTHNWAAAQSSMHCNEVNVFRKLLVKSLGKSTLPIKKVGKCNGGKRAMSAVWNEQADQQLPRPH